MYHLSEYRLSPADAHALRISDGYSLHRVVYDLFEDVRKDTGQEHSGILFADRGARQGIRTLLVLSDRLPRPPRYGTLQTRDLPQGYLAAKRYNFTVIINPVRRESASRKLVPVCGREAVGAWFAAKAPSWGFAVDEATLQVNDITVERFDKKGVTVTLSRATLSGSLEVQDGEAFARAVQQGIGRGRAFGCGLLQVIPF